MGDSILRKYHMADSELIVYANNLTSPMTRDAAEFLAKGVTALMTTELGTKAAEFAAFPSDEYYHMDVLIAAEAKNTLRLAMEVKIRDIVQLGVIKWGQRSYQVKRFAAGNMTNDTESDFVTTANKVVNTATLYLTDLTPLGLTQAMIDALEADALTMLADIKAVHSAELLRDVKAEERIEMGNELYDLVAKYCEIGKIIWDDVDPAKYNDYVIYQMSPGVPGKIMMLSFAAPSQTFSWAAEPSATEYQLEFSVITPQLNWVEVYRGPMTSFIHLMGPGQTVYRCRGINSNGYGYWSDNLIVTRI